MFEGMFTEENRKKIITTSVILLIVVIFVFYILPLFLKSNGDSKILPSEIVINEEELNLKTGESYLFIPDLYPSSVTDEKIKWSSNNPMIASVDENGMVKAIRPGIAIITATTSNKLTDFSIVEVVVGNKDVASLSLNMEDISLKVGTKKKFEVILDPVDIEYESVEWETDNNKVVTIDQNGEVYGLAVGKAVITAKVKIDSLTTLSISSNVEVVKETTLFANKSSSLKQLYPYKELELSVRLSDENIEITDLNVFSENENIVKKIGGPTIEDKGIIVFKVQGVAVGTTNVFVKMSTRDGESLQLVLPAEVKSFTGITLDKSSVSLNAEEQTIVNAKVSPAIGVAMHPTCTVSDPTIAQTYTTYANNDSYNGACLIKGIKRGKTTVNVSLAGKSKSITVYVNSNLIETTKITLNHTNETIPVGQTLTLKATVLPTDATDKTVTWTSSNNEIATVSNGIVATYKPGKVTITAKSSGGQTATATITVTETDASISGNNVPVESISIDPNTAQIKKGESITLRVTFYPSNATDKTVTWASSNSDLVTVKDGVITAKANSNEPITITAMSGNGKIATATINIIDGNEVAATGITINKSDITLEVGDKQTLTAKVTPTNVTNKTVTWASNNNDIVTVSNGVVTGITIGETTVIAQNSSGQTATVKVKVVKKSSSSSSGGSTGGSTGGGTSGGGTSGGATSKSPTITITKSSGTSGDNGWYTSNVVLKISVDAPAGLESLKYCVSADGASCTPVAMISNGEKITLSNQGKSLKVRVTAVDKEGNSITKTSSAYKIDKTKPTCKITVSSLSTGFRLNATGSDSHSGLYGIRDWTTSTYTNTIGKSKNVQNAGTYKFYVKDNAGNTNSCSETLYKCGRVRSCKTCTSGDCTKGCDSWNSWTGWQKWNDAMYSVQTKTAYNQVESGVFMNSDCSNG